jgi:hypothetical protein
LSTKAKGETNELQGNEAWIATYPSGHQIIAEGQTRYAKYEIWDDTDYRAQVTGIVPTVQGAPDKGTYAISLYEYEMRRLFLPRMFSEIKISMGH